MPNMREVESPWSQWCHYDFRLIFSLDSILCMISILKGEIPKIAFEWFEWVKYWNETPFPEDALILEKYSGQRNDTGPAITVKILTANS